MAENVLLISRVLKTLIVMVSASVLVALKNDRIFLSPFSAVYSWYH